MISIEQIRAARAMLNLSQRDLAAKAGISVATLNNIERGVQTDPKISTMKAIQSALETAGIDFVTDQFGGMGVYMKTNRGNRTHAKVLIIDDNASDRELYKAWMKSDTSRSYSVSEADNARGGYDAFINDHPDCIVLDFMMYGTDGFQLLAGLRREQRKLPPIVFITAMHSDIMKENAKAQGVHAYLDKKQMRKEDFLLAIDGALRS